MSWQDATVYCETLGLNGHPWRVPSLKELATLMDDAAPINSNAAIVDPLAFPTMLAAQYWSSTVLDGSQPWTFNFADGSTEHTQSNGFARCVR